MGWLAWGAFIPWLIALEKGSPRQAFLRSYLVGVLFFAGTIWWVGYVTIPGTILLVAYLALFFGAWGRLAHRMLRNFELSPLTLPSPPMGERIKGRGPFSILFGLPAAWVVLEFLRSTLLTGFGWNLIAHTQWNWIPVIQIADLTGVWGVSFLVVLVNVAGWQVVKGQRSEDRRQKTEGRGQSVFCFLSSVLCLLTALAYGHFRLHRIDSSHSPIHPFTRSRSFKVAVVQGNIPQTEKWDEAFQEEIWHRYETLTGQAAQSRPDLIIWPETAVPGYLEDPHVAERLQKSAPSAQTPLLVGVPVGEMAPESPRVFNSAVLLDASGTVVDRYDKVHLVPFGEYVPLGPLLGWLREFVLMGDFSPGGRFTVFKVGKEVPPFSVLICFEDLFPDLSRRFVQEGARWLLVITNDAWFHRSAASLQHLQASVFRAIENRVWVVRAANTGWSGFIDPAGRRISSVPRFESGVDSLSLRRESRYNLGSP